MIINRIWAIGGSKNDILCTVERKINVEMS